MTESSTFRSVRKFLCTATILSGVLGAASPASAAEILPDFTLDINAVSTVINSQTLLVADKFTGNYNEVFSVTSFDAGSGAGTFSTLAYWDMGQIVQDDGTVAINSALGSPCCSYLGVHYAIYGLFTSSGTFAANALGGTTFTGTAGNISLVLDQSGNTGKTLPGSTSGTPPLFSAITLTNTGDDTQLASATLLKGEGKTGGGLASGDFGLLFNPFELTSLGDQFFYAPKPFYLDIVLKGQFNSFSPSAGLNQRINGSADAFFSAVPEPATMTMLGLGLVGLAAKRRRKVQA